MNQVARRWGHEEQRDAVQQWLLGPAASRAASRVCFDHRLPADLADDLRHDAYLRVQRTFDRRDDPYPELHDDRAAERYARRVLTRVAIDRSRCASSRREVLAGTDPTVTEDHEAGSTGSSGRRHLERRAAEDIDRGLDDVEWQDLGIWWRRSLGREIERQPACHGCPTTVVAAVALFVVNVVTARSVTSDDELGELVRQGLVAHDPTTFAGAEQGALNDRQRQRKSRCGQCVLALLRTAATAQGADHE